MEWAPFLAAPVCGRNFTQKIHEQFFPLVEEAAHQFLTEQVNERLKTALGSDGETAAVVVVTPPAPQPASALAQPGEAQTPDRADEIVTTSEELDGFRVVRAIVCSEVAATRVVGRDAKTYYGVLLDDNNRKPIARLWFNRAQWYLGVFDENKTETRMPISRVEDIYRHADLLRATVAGYLAKVGDKAPAA